MKANNLKTIRQKIRSGQYTSTTSGLMPDLLQGNLVILPSSHSDEFLTYCAKNSKACPVIGYSQPGKPVIPHLGDFDLRYDLPQYHVFCKGKFVTSTTNIMHYWNNNSVAIVLGCSYTFENALLATGCQIRNITEKVNVSMYITNIATIPTTNFGGKLVVSMRPFKAEQIDIVQKTTAQFPKAHGEPIHIGNPQDIGIIDINKPDFGDNISIKQDDITVFWACGVTSQLALNKARLPLTITHAPGKMLITDIRYQDLHDDHTHI